MAFGRLKNYGLKVCLVSSLVIYRGGNLAARSLDGYFDAITHGHTPPLSSHGSCKPTEEYPYCTERAMQLVSPQPQVLLLLAGCSPLKLWEPRGHKYMYMCVCVCVCAHVRIIMHIFLAVHICHPSTLLHTLIPIRQSSFL